MDLKDIEVHYGLTEVEVREGLEMELREFPEGVIRGRTTKGKLAIIVDEGGVVEIKNLRVGGHKDSLRLVFPYDEHGHSSFQDIECDTQGVSFRYGVHDTPYRVNF